MIGAAGRDSSLTSGDVQFSWGERGYIYEAVSACSANYWHNPADERRRETEGKKLTLGRHAVVSGVILILVKLLNMCKYGAQFDCCIMKCSY